MVIVLVPCRVLVVVPGAPNNYNRSIMQVQSSEFIILAIPLLLVDILETKESGPRDLS